MVKLMEISQKMKKVRSNKMVQLNPSLRKRIAIFQVTERL